MSQMFDPDNHTRSHAHKELYARGELIYTIIDVAAAALFVLGSILFFFESTVFAGTWLFLVGSILFGARPSVKLWRELGYRRLNAQDRKTKDQS